MEKTTGGWEEKGMARDALIRRARDGAASANAQTYTTHTHTDTDTVPISKKKQNTHEMHTIKSIQFEHTVALQWTVARLCVCVPLPSLLHRLL